MLFVPNFDLVLIKNTINLKEDNVREALQFHGLPVVSNGKMLILVIQNLKLVRERSCRQDSMKF